MRIDLYSRGPGRDEASPILRTGRGEQREKLGSGGRRLEIALCASNRLRKRRGSGACGGGGMNGGFREGGLSRGAGGC